MYAHIPLSPRFARHCPRNRGQLTTKEERIHSFYFLYTFLMSILCRILRSHSYFVYIFQFFTHACHRSRMTAEVNYIFKEFFTVVSKRKNRKRKPSPLVGGRWRRSRRKGQVGADTVESFLQNSIKYLPVILERSEESGKGYGD